MPQVRKIEFRKNEKPIHKESSSPKPTSTPGGSKKQEDRRKIGPSRSRRPAPAACEEMVSTAPQRPMMRFRPSGSGINSGRPVPSTMWSLAQFAGPELAAPKQVLNLIRRLWTCNEAAEASVKCQCQAHGRICSRAGSSNNVPQFSRHSLIPKTGSVRGEGFSNKEERSQESPCCRVTKVRA